MTEFEKAVTRVIAAIPSGEVLTYGEAAELAGYPGAARAVGNLLSHTPQPLPWWRVVGAGLEVRTSEEQVRLLVREGWKVDGRRLLLDDARYSRR